MTRRRQVWVAAVLWVAFAFTAWNVVFDRVIVLAGRQYVHDAATAARSGAPYLRIDDVMRPAIGRGVQLASAVAASIAGVGLTAVVFAARRDARHLRSTSSKNDAARGSRD